MHAVRIRPTSWLALALVALLVPFLLAVPALAAPPPGKGGGNGGGGGGGSAPVAEQHLLWRVQLAGVNARVRPVVGPDGTVYAVDTSDRLTAVAPDGTVRWTAEEAGGDGLDIGPDGTIYTANENWVKAWNPAGAAKWTFVQNPRAFVFPGIGVGPEGHVYGIGTSGMGVFALADRGDQAELLWQTPEVYSRPIVSHTEIEFGPTAAGDGHQLYFYANGRTKALRTDTGDVVFSHGNNTFPRVSPVDGTWHGPTTAYAPDGSPVWTFDTPLASGTSAPELSVHGTHFAVNGGDDLYAVDPDGRIVFVTTLDEFAGLPNVDPTESVVLLPVGGLGEPVAMKAVSASNGSPLWRMEFPLDPSGVNQSISSRVAYSADGSVAYVTTTTLTGNGPIHLNAIATDPSIPSASTILRSASVDVSGKFNRKGASATGVVIVTDQNRAPIAGAMVRATWTLPDGSTVPAAATSGGSGEARFSASFPERGIFTLTVTDIVLDGFVFDPLHGETAGSRFI